MKKALFLAALAAMLLALASCGEAGTVTAPPPVSGASASPSASGEASPAPTQAPGFAAGDIALKIDGNTYVCDVPADMLIATFGEDYVYGDSPSCAYEGLDKSFEYADFTVYTYPQGASDYILEIYAVGGNIETTRGITFGATEAEIAAVYGDGYEIAGVLMRYEIPGSGEGVQGAALEFEMRDGEVAAIGIVAEQVLAE